jgi:hypothetical protein
MDKHYKTEGRYSYYEAGEGTPIVILHGLMGGLSNLLPITSLQKDISFPICQYTRKTF